VSSQRRPSAASLKSVVARLGKQGVRTVHIGLFDLDGVFRERRLPLAAFAEMAAASPTFCNVLHQWDSGADVFGTGPFVGEPIAADTGSLRANPMEPDSVYLVADFTGPSVALSPRELLKAQIDRAAALGYDALAAFEFEFTILDESATSLRDKGYEGLDPYAADNTCWSGLSAAVYGDLVGEIDATLAAADIPLFGLGMELGPGCLEATLAARPALRAADDAAFMKMLTKAACRRRDLTASFMAQLGTGFQGLSGHVHLSLRDRKTGRPAFGRGRRKDVLKPAMGHFIGGLVTQLPDLAALCCHTANAYRRMVPGNWAPRTACWAEQNYRVAVRAVADAGDADRIEFRIPGADTNPFLALALTLGAGLWGIENAVEPPPPVEDDPFAPEHPPLPRTLYDAALRLEASAVARDLFGDAFIDHFAASRKREDDLCRREVSAFERARYIELV